MWCLFGSSNNLVFHTAASHTHKNKTHFKLLPVHQIKFMNLEMCLKADYFLFLLNKQNEKKKNVTNAYSLLFKKDLKEDKGLS